MAGDRGAFGVNTYSYVYSHEASACLAHLAGLGYRDIELMMYPGHAWPAEMAAGDRRALAKVISDHGLRLRTLNMPNLDLNVAAANPEMRALSLKNLVEIVELAGELGVPGVVLGPGKPNPLFPNPPDHLMGWFHNALDTLVPAAAKAGTRMVAENMPFGFLPRADQMMAALDDYGADEVGVVYDVANAVFAREDPVEGLRLVKDRLDLVHLSDTGLEAYRHDPVGRGVVDFGEFAEGLKGVGYSGIAMLEVISDDADADIAGSADQLLAMAPWRSFLSVGA